MKIVFKDSELKEGLIKVSLDGGFTFADYEIADVKDSGIPLANSQELNKINIKGPANILRNLQVISSLKLEGAESGNSKGLNFIVDTETYGFAFPDCVTGIILPDGITIIGNDPNQLLPIPDGGKGEKVVEKIPAKGYYSANNVFCLFPNLQTIVIPESVTTISDYAFSDCSSLTSITIPDGVTTISDYAFSDCSSLTSITIPDGVTSIGSYAFVGCTSLESITISDGVTSIGSYAFASCTSLTSVTIPESVTSIGSYAFSDCTGLTSITIPESVTSIGAFAFENCSSLTSVTIPSNVAEMGERAFAGCTSLESITISDGVTTISDFAFQNCSSLTSITIPESVTSIGAFAFENCTGLTSITIPETVTSIGDSAFNGCPLTDECFLSVRKPDTIYGDVVYETVMTGGYYSYTVTEDGNYTVELEDSRCKDDMYFYIYINNTVKDNHDDIKSYYSFELAQGDVITVKYCYYSNHNDSLDESIEPNIGKDLFRVYKKSA